MIVASWNLLADSKEPGELPPIKMHNTRGARLVNRVWRIVMWAQGTDGEQIKKEARTERGNLDQVVERIVDELLEILREKSPLAAAGMRVELLR